MTKLQSLRAAWLYLAPLDAGTRLHQLLRCLLAPFPELLECLPEDGKLLDVGCGHGTFLAQAGRRHPRLELAGFDLDERKIASARRAFAASELGTGRLEVRDVLDFEGEPVDAITLVDVLYLVPFDGWKTVLEACRAALRPGGRLLLKEIDRTKRWRFALLVLEELLAVRLLRWTKGRTFTFPPPEEIRKALEEAGFTVEDRSLGRGYHVPHHLWIAGR